MAKPEWGLKRACASCSTRFYDLGRDPIICPSCGATYDPLALLRPKRGRAAALAAQEARAPAPVEAVVEADDTEDVVDETLDDDEDDDVIEDASELGEDDDDVSEVVEGVDEGDER